MQNKSFLEKYVRIIVVLAVVAGSSSGIFVAAIKTPPMAIGFWRLTMSLPFFAIPVIFNGRDKLAAVSARDFLLSMTAGIFLFLHFFTWFNAVRMTNIASAVSLAAMHPLIVLVITVFVFKQSVNARQILGIVLALLGATMVAGLDRANLTSGNFKGDMLAFAAAMAMGIYFVLGNVVRRRVDGSTYVFLCFSACWIAFSVGMVFTDTSAIGYSTRDYLLLAALTLTCQIGAHAVFNLCMGYVDSLYVSAWESGESIFAIALSLIFLRQIPEYWEVIGAAIVVTGLLYYNRFSNPDVANQLKDRSNGGLLP